MIDWSKAPEGATHYDPEEGVWYKRQQGYWDVFTVNINDWRWATAWGVFPMFEAQLIPRPATCIPKELQFTPGRILPGPPPDAVNHPPHYQLRDGYEVYDLRQDLAAKAAQHDVPHDQYSDWDRALEYLLRMWGKNEVEDAKKARWYLNKLIEKLEVES
jgi:hypothetical protein